MPLTNLAALVAVVSAIKWLVSIHKKHTLYLKEKNQEEYQACRVKLSPLLGFIAAPPLSDISCDDGPFDMNDLELVLEFCQEHVGLIQQMDDSLEKLRIATSIVP